MPTINTYSFAHAAVVFVAIILGQVVNAFYAQWRGDGLEAAIVGGIAVGVFVISGVFSARAVLRKKYPTWDGRTLAKNATSKADRDITRTKLFLVLFAFGVLATVLWFVCLGVYANNFVGDDTPDNEVIIAWLVALPAANYMAYRAAKAVLRRKHPTWNGKIPKWRAKVETATEVEKTF